MSSISKPADASDATAFKQTFCDSFSITDLLRIYDEEVEHIQTNIGKQERRQLKKAKESRENVASWKETCSRLLKQEDARDKHFTPYIPKTIAYIKDNIMHSNDGNYYVISYNKDSGLYPKELDTQKVKNVYVNYFPPLVKKWFLIYHITVTISVDHMKPRRYNESNQEYLNLFNGYPFDKFERDQTIIDSQTQNIEIFLKHIREVLCSNNEAIYNEVILWIYALVGGKRKMKTALYFKGIKGAGKSILLFVISTMLGKQNSINIQTASQILGDFNGHLAGKLFVYLDDTPLTFDEFSRLYAHLKVPITESYNTYRDLFKTAISLLNISSFIICSNHPCLKLEASTGEERRYVISQVCNILRDERYFIMLWGIAENINFQKAFYWHCQDNYDADYNEQVSVKKLPKTETALEAIQASLTPVMEFIKTMLEDEIFDKPMKPKDVYTAYTAWYIHQNQLDRKRCKKYDAFRSEMTSFPFITIHKERMEGEEKTNWLRFDRNGCILDFNKRGFFSKFDDLSSNSIDPLLYYENRKQELLLELERIEAQLKLEIQKRNEDEECIRMLNEGKDDKWRKRIIDPSKTIIIKPSLPKPKAFRKVKKIRKPPQYTEITESMNINPTLTSQAIVDIFHTPQEVTQHGELQEESPTSPPPSSKDKTHKYWDTFTLVFD